MKRLIKGKVKNTGWEIDGHILYFALWEYDPEKWHLHGWDDADDEAVMKTIWRAENLAGWCLYDTFEEFKKAWTEKECEPQASFCLTPDQVEVVEVLRENKEE